MNQTISDMADKALARALTRKGQFSGFLWVRPMKTRKGVSSVITKEVRCVARVGIDYEHKQSTIEGREDGTLPAENGGLPWGKWKQFPYLIEHTNKDGIYSIYLRLYPVANGKPKVRYRINGQLARKEEIESLCLASEFRESDDNCITLNISHLQRMK